MCGACGWPCASRTAPGRIVSNTHAPSAPVGSRPKPQKPGGRQHVLRIIGTDVHAIGVGLPQLHERVRHRRAVAVEDADPAAGSARRGCRRAPGSRASRCRPARNERTVRRSATRSRRRRAGVWLMRARSYTIPLMTPHSSTTTDRPFERLAVVGAGNMGSGIAQKMATEGFAVILVDLDDEQGRARPEHHREDARGRRGSAASSTRRGRRDSRRHHRDVPIRGSGRRRPGGRGGLRGPRRQEERLPPPRRGLPPGRDPRDQHVVLRGHRAGRARRRGPSASSGCTTSITRRRTGSSRSSPGQATDPAAHRRAWRLQEALGKTPDRLERLVRLHRQPLLRAVAERSRAHARGGRRRHRDDRRGREEGVRHRHGAVRADERHRRADRVARRDDARPGVRADVRIAGAPSRPGGTRRSRGTIDGTPDAGAVRRRSPIALAAARSSSPARSSTRASARSRTPTSARASACAGAAARSS